jgi:mediator of RNA polymerase II transcription subunit 13
MSFLLIPEVFVSHAKALAHNQTFGMERLAMMVYDSIPRSMVRQHSRLSSQKYVGREDTDAFAFSLARRQPSKIMFAEQWPPTTASIFDRYHFLHVGYSVTLNGEWVAAVATTETGDGQESLVWEIDEHDAIGSIGSIVRGVLDFTFRIAGKADIEWRVTITKNDVMSAAELDGMSIS